MPLPAGVAHEAAMAGQALLVLQRIRCYCPDGQLGVGDGCSPRAELYESAVHSSRPINVCGEKAPARCCWGCCSLAQRSASFSRADVREFSIKGLFRAAITIEGHSLWWCGCGDLICLLWAAPGAAWTSSGLRSAVQGHFTFTPPSEFSAGDTEGTLRVSDGSPRVTRTPFISTK